MNRDLKTALIHFAVAAAGIAAFVAINGCGRIDRNIHHVTTVTFEIHVVGDRHQFDWPYARQLNGPSVRSNVGAYAKSGNPPEIWLTGYRDEQGIRVDRIDFLGHEVLEV